MAENKMNWVAGQDVLNVLHQYAWAFDSNDMELLAGVFHEQAITRGVVAGTDLGWGPWKGREEIVSQLGSIRKVQTDTRRHQMTTPIFLELSETHARVKLYLSLLSTERGQLTRLVTTGEYDARLSMASGVWRIDSLTARLDGNF